MWTISTCVPAASRARLVGRNFPRIRRERGFTEEQVSKVKTDLVAEVTPVVTSQNQTGKYTPDQCNPLLQTYLKLPSSSEEAPTSSSAADQGSSSSSAQ